jgi:hypothetical protein
VYAYFFVVVAKSRLECVGDAAACFLGNLGSLRAGSALQLGIRPRVGVRNRSGIRIGIGNDRHIREAVDRLIDDARHIREFNG